MPHKVRLVAITKLVIQVICKSMFQMTEPNNKPRLEKELVKVQRLSKEREAIKILRSYILKGFGKRRCKEMVADCGECNAHIFLAFLNSYDDFIEWTEENP